MNKTLPKITTITFVENTGKCSNLPKLGYNEILKAKKEEISKLNYRDWLSNRKRLLGPQEFQGKRVSRAYYKLGEILSDIDITGITDVLCLCEAPGGFAQYLLEKTNSKVFLFSLVSRDPSVPTFNPIIKNNARVAVLSNSTNKGDITNMNNIRGFASKKVDLVTADGGIADKNFELKEQAHLHLIYCEVLSACYALKNDGTLILKIFDTFTEKMHDIVCIVSYLFDVQVVKPPSSRATNSEKYLVCTHFSEERFKGIEKNLVRVASNFSKRRGFLQKPVSALMVQSLSSLNRDLMNKQIDAITKCLN